MSPTCACSVAASCWSSTTCPGSQRAAQEAEGLDVVEVAGRHGEDRAGAGADRARPARGARCAGERRRRGGGRLQRRRAARATPRGDSSAAARSEPTGPCQSSGTLRIALAGHRPQRVPDEEQHRRRAARPRRRASARAASVRPGARARPASASRAATLMRAPPRATTRPSSSSTLAVVARGDVGVVGGDDEREAELALQRVDQVEHALARVGVEVAGRLVAEQQLAAAARARGRSRRAAPRRPRAPPAGGRPCPRARRARAARSGASPAPVGRRDAGREGDVLERGEVRQQVRALEDVGDAARPHARRARPRRARRAARPCHSTVPAVGSTRPPSTCSSVVLPEPERPEQRDRSPAPDREIDAVERAHARHRRAP